MIATVALGYADGLPRAASNKGMAAIGGSRVPVVGRISMDLTTLDVSALKTPPEPGDAVELLGDTVTLSQAAEAAGTNEYEILTGLAARLPRAYTDDAA